VRPCCARAGPPYRRPLLRALQGSLFSAADLLAMYRIEIPLCLLLFAFSFSSFAGDSENWDISSTHLLSSPDLLFAYATAHEAHLAWKQGQGESSSTESAWKASWGVYVVKQEDGNFLVVFLPPTPMHRGGGVEYLVDGTSFSLIEQRFSR